MKKAIIVVGKHHSGKSLTIRGHLNPLLKIGYDAHKFTLNGKNGYVLSQTFEEALKKFLDDSARLSKLIVYELLVLAARPETEPDSQLNLIREFLQDSSFAVEIIYIQDKSEAPEKAKAIFTLLNSN
jgi:hypothetical protein